MSKFNKKKVKFDSFRVKMKVSAINHQKEDFGIFRCIPLESAKDVKLNWRGEFNLKGNIPYNLKVDKVYTVYMGNPEYNEQYKNYTYTIDKFEIEQLTKPEEQFEFLQTVTTPDIYNQLSAQYPNTNIIDLIFANQIDISKVKGLGEATYEKLKEKLDLYKDLGKLQSLLAPLGVNVKAVTKIAKHFESPDKAFYILSESLYNLCEVKGYGFKKVDEICLKAKVDVRDPIRLSECLKYIIDENTKDGHSWSYRDDIIAQSLEYLNIEPELLESILNNAPYTKDKYYKPNDIIVVGELVTLYRLYKDEHNTLMNLIRIRDNYVPPVLEDIDELITEAENYSGFKFAGEQLEAIKESFSHGVYVINGGAGSGKTSLVKAITIIIESMGRSYMSAALSGKASKVLSSKDIKSSTIHRMLGYNGEGFAFNENKPLPYHTVILDEASMTNANLWASVTSAIGNGFQLIVVGDANQISGIGAADVLRDLLNTNQFKRRELVQIHRQARDSGVIEVAHKFKNGENITGYNREITETYGKNEDLTIITRSKPKKDSIPITTWMSEEDIKEAQNPIYQIAKEITKSQITKIKQSLNPEKEIIDFQVIVPTKSSGALSVDSFNKLIQREYNDSTKKIKLGKGEYYENDKIMNNGNAYRLFGYESIEHYKLGKLIMNEVIEEVVSINEDGTEHISEMTTIKPKEFDLFNGTMGIIKHVDLDAEVILAKFEGLDCLISLDDEACEGIDLGYAITLHKSQGDSIPNVLLAFDFGAFKMLSKELIYTGITRTSGKCVMICENNALFRGISQTSSGNRRTFMSLFLQQLDNANESE